MRLHNLEAMMVPPWSFPHPSPNANQMHLQIFGCPLAVLLPGAPKTKSSNLASLQFLKIAPILMHKLIVPR